jgi:hypothetical protein
LGTAAALHPFDPAEQVRFLSRAESRPGESTPSHSLIAADLEEAARGLGDEFAQRKERALKEFCERHLAVAALNRQGAGPEAMGPFVVEFLRAAASLIRIGLRPALHLRGQLLDRLSRPEPATPPGGLPGACDPGTTGEAANVFRRDGNDWSIRYLRSQMFALKVNAGSAYVHYLLERPGRAVSVAELAAYWDRTQMPDHCLPAAGEVEANRSGDDGPVLDDAALRQVDERLSRITAELAEARNNDDDARVAELKDEWQYLTRARSRATRPGGGPVLIGNQDRRLTDRVTKAITRTVGVITKKNAALGRHLGNSITTGAVCGYDPESPTRWEL